MALLGATTAGPSSDWTRKEEPTTLWDVVQEHRNDNEDEYANAYDSEDDEPTNNRGRKNKGCGLPDSIC